LMLWADHLPHSIVAVEGPLMAQPRQWAGARE
jgi:hypothetical protein